MRAKTHPGPEKRVETSSSDETMDMGKHKMENPQARREASDEMSNDSGLSAGEIASQSGYDQNSADVAEQAADADKNRSK